MSVQSPARVVAPQVGRSMQRLDGREKLRGEAEFVGDMSVPGMLFGKVLRSPVPHARIVSIDASRAEAMPGVACVLTGRDLADIDPYWGHAIRDRPIVAIDRVRFHGEPVAAVAADDEATAARALLEIDVTYEELRVAGTIEQAIAPEAPIVNDGPLRPGLFHGLGELPPRDGNVCYRYRIERGEVEAAFAHADIVVEGDYEFPAVYQYAMETHTVIAQVERGEITLWATCQHPFLVRAEIAALFERPLTSVRVIVLYFGGGFGLKSYTKMEPITVALTRKARRPVRIQNAVGESMVTSRRHGMKARVRTAATSDGRLLGREVECWFDTGAYADNGPRVTATGGDAAPGPYRWESFRVDARCVYTNTAPSGSYRAFGATHRAVDRREPGGARSLAAAASIHSSCAGRTCVCPARRSASVASRSTPTWSATSSRPPPRSGGTSRRHLCVGRGVSGGLLAAGAQPGLDGHRAAGRPTAGSPC